MREKCIVVYSQLANLSRIKSSRCIWIHLPSIFSVIHFNLDYSITLPTLRKSVSNSRKILAIHLRTFVLFSFYHIFFVFISMPSPLPPKGNSQLLPINSIFLRIHNFLLNSEKCGLYKRFKLLPCDIKVIKKLRFISPPEKREMDIFRRAAKVSHFCSLVHSFVHSQETPVHDSRSRELFR